MPAGGSGKSTLSKHIVSKLAKSNIIGMDFYYDPVLIRCDFIRVKNELIVPLKEGKRATSKVYDWPNEQFLPGGWLEPSGIHIFEGWYSMEENLAGLFDYKIWVDCPPDVGMERGLKRDNHIYEDRWVNTWVPEMKKYIQIQNPHLKADMIINYKDIPRNI